MMKQMKTPEDPGVSPVVDKSHRVVPFTPPDDSAACEREEENAWLLRVRDAADADAFRRLFERLVPRLHGYLRRNGVALADAENALQDVWLVVWRKAGQFDPTLASARTWIFTLLRNRLIDIDRAARREARLTGLFAATAQDDVLEEPDLPAQVQGGRIARLLNRLPPEQRDVLLQCYVEGRTQREIAETLSLPIGTVKSRARLAFERVKAMLREPA
jgi:RNA polymerase sigma-70 factor (ECF subfamily)